MIMIEINSFEAKYYKNVYTFPKPLHDALSRQSSKKKSVNDDKECIEVYLFFSRVRLVMNPVKKSGLF